MSVPNPYSSPDDPAQIVHSGVPRLAIVWRRPVYVLILALLGYILPFFVLFARDVFENGNQAFLDLRNLPLNLLAVHWPFTIASWALLIPNVCCMAFAGFTAHSLFISRSCRLLHCVWVWLVLATMIGYAITLVVLTVHNPIPRAWSAEWTNLASSAMIMLLPLVTWGVHSSSTRNITRTAGNG